MKICALLGLSLLGCLCFGQVRAGSTSQLRDAVVEVSVAETNSSEFEHSGTGWLYAEQSMIITAKHVVAGYDEWTTDDKGEAHKVHREYAKIRVTFSDGQQLAALLCKKSKTEDVALLYVDKSAVKDKARSLLELNTDKLEVGTSLMGSGFPLDLSCLFLFGHITGYTNLDTTLDTGDAVIGEYLVTDACFNPGDSGGPLVDVNTNKVVAMMVFVRQGANAVSFGLPAFRLAKVIQELTGERVQTSMVTR
ncbi:MAG: trypsin-like peptidase domain-containing protein [Armatimonadetes bacterium]|nr:trypsin-like peptidase domain-containing protein [Armatimonadota bacterium]